MLIYSAAVTAILASVPALGHDPLKDERDREHSNHHNVHQEKSYHRANLPKVRALVVSFRETGDDHYLDNARALLEPTLESATRDPETLIAAASVAQSRHEFGYAVKLLTEALITAAGSAVGRREATRSHG